MDFSMYLHITSLYAALLAFLFVYLSIRVIRLRSALKISIGVGRSVQSENQAEPSEILRAIRAHANLSEYAPFALLLIGLLEIQGMPDLWVHALGFFLLFGRCLHAYGISQTNEQFVFRVSGMMLTFSVMLIAASLLILYTYGFMNP
jgi:uncharacterized protein